MFTIYPVVDRVERYDRLGSVGDWLDRLRWLVDLSSTWSTWQICDRLDRLDKCVIDSTDFRRLVGLEWTKMMPHIYLCSLSELDVDAHEFIPVLTNKPSKVFRSLLLIKLKFPDTNIFFTVRSLSIFENRNTSNNNYYYLWQYIHLTRHFPPQRQIACKC